MALRNAFGVVDEFEGRVAEYSGSKYAIAVDCCTSALFLCFKYVLAKRVICPARTYVSVPMAVIHSGAELEFEDFDWKGVYQLKPHPVFDGAKRFTKGMYQGGLHCLSFHSKKILNIGRGGMILTDSEHAMKWLKLARYDGREEKHYGEGDIKTLGWHVYMTPDVAARGLTLLDVLPEENEDLTEDYPDLRTMPVFQ
jgi:dTDP-4-amino-4,6-dideoxygalactose transaminase